MLGGKFAAGLPRALLAFGTISHDNHKSRADQARGIQLPFEPGRYYRRLWLKIGNAQNECSRLGPPERV
jgi:hypothetical protein